MSFAACYGAASRCETIEDGDSRGFYLPFGVAASVLTLFGGEVASRFKKEESQENL